VAAAIESLAMFGRLQFPSGYRPTMHEWILIQIISIPLNLLIYALTMLLAGGACEIALSQLEGKSSHIRRLFSGFKRVRQFFVAGALVMIPNLILSWAISNPATRAVSPYMPFALLPCQLWLEAIVCFAPIFIIREDMPGLDAIKLSVLVLLPQSLKMTVILLAASFVTASGVFACCIGIIFTVPYAYIVIAVNYSYFFKLESASNPTVPG